MNSKCENCRFWISFKGDKAEGRCRRWNPDVVANVSGGGVFGIGGFSTTVETHWPKTQYDDWCGEHESREPKATESK